MDYVKNILRNKATTLVDVRSHSEFRDGSVPGAINIPLDEVADRWREFQVMQKPVVLFCRTGARSGVAVAMLERYGIDGLFNGGSIENVKNSMLTYV